MFSYEAAGAMEWARRAVQENYNWEAYANQLKARIAQLELEVISKMAAVEGANTVIRGFMMAHPDSPVLSKTKAAYTGKGRDGSKERVGELKTVGRIVWERAHDAYLKARGINNPLQHRDD